MKILFVDQNSSLGGGQRVLLDLVSYAKNCGHDVSLLLPDEGYVTKAAREAGIPVCTFSFPVMTPGRKSILEKISYPYHSFRASGAVSGRALQFEADLIFANGPRVFLPCAMAGKSAGIPVHLQLHLLFEQGIEKQLISYLLKSDAVRSAVACSEKVFEPFKDIFPQKMKVVPYWVSPPFLTELSRRDEIRKSLSLDVDKIAVGVMGRISPTKGQKLFMNALLPLQKKYEALHLVIAGWSDFESGNEEREIRETARASGNGERIHFTGMVEGSDFYDGMDVLVVPSMWEEPFGLVSVEGMARELPVVATRSGALAEIVEDGKTGFVVSKDEKQLREAVEKLLLSKELRAEMGFRGKERVMKYFNPDSQIKKVMDIALNEH
jgi:glycosyltransferase involved in cell wall biosynthesis